MKSLYALLIICGTLCSSFQVDIQWGTSNPLTLDLRSFQPEAEFWNKTALRFQQSFIVDTDRTHNRMEKACKGITQPYTQVKDREDRDYIRRRSYVKAIRISQTPQTIPANQQIPPFKHPYPRSARGIAFFGNGNCKGEPKLIIWPKQAADMDYPTPKRYEILRSPTEVENFYYKWAQTFEFSDFDIKKDPNSHYNVARPQLQYLRNPEDPEKIDEQRKKYPENAWLKKGTLGSPIGTPYHQPLGSFREIFPTRSDRIWRQIIRPPDGDTSYWNIPMINVQLDHRNVKGQQRKNFFRTFVPYGLLDSSWATVFELIEQEYARFYKAMVDLLGVPGNSPIKRLKWSTKRQAAALQTLAPAFDPWALFPQESLGSPRSMPNDKALENLHSFQVYTSSPTVPDPREWTLPPSWEEVPVWNSKAGRLVKNAAGKTVLSGAYEKVPNPNRIIYSSVQLQWLRDDKFTFTTSPVVSDPTAALEKESVMEQMPSIEHLPLVEPPLEAVVEVLSEEQPPVKINTGADLDLRTAQGTEEEKEESVPIEAGQGIESPLLSPFGSPSSRSQSFGDPQEPIMPSLSDEGTAGTSSLRAESMTEAEDSYEIVAEAGRRELNRNLGASTIVTRPRSRGGVSGERPNLHIESLTDSRVSYRPQDGPLILPQYRGSRMLIPSTIEVLKDSVIQYRPPPPQNLRENILRASQHPNADGDIIVPVGDDLAESIVFNSRRRPVQMGPIPAALSGSSGTGKKSACIIRPREQRVAAGVCSVLVCCS